MNRREVWQRNEPIEGLPPLFWPLAYALAEVKEEMMETIATSEVDFYARPGGAACIAFHLKHIGGVLERMATYAAGRPLSPAQLDALQSETAEDGQSREALIHQCLSQIDTFIDFLGQIPPQKIYETRYLGRQRLPLMLWGLLVHGVEHATRHWGQTIATEKFLKKK